MDRGPSKGPSKSDVRKRALTQAIVTAVIGLLVLFVLDHALLGKIVLGISAILLITGFVVPPAFQAIERFGQKLGVAVGAGLTWGLLVPFFYLCFLPAHLLIKLLKKDPLKTRFPTDEPTYWSGRHPMTEAHFKRQY